MKYEVVLTRNGYKQALQIITDTFKNLRVWKVRFQDGEEAVFFKCGTEWFQRNEDGLDRWLPAIFYQYSKEVYTLIQDLQWTTWGKVN